MRLIDIDKITEHDVCVYLGMGYASCCDDVMDLLNDQPEVDAVPVRRGAWVESKCLDDGFWMCSCCEFVSEASGARILYKYCPYCGADMRGTCDA